MSFKIYCGKLRRTSIPKWMSVFLGIPFYPLGFYSDLPYKQQRKYNCRFEQQPEQICLEFRLLAIQP